MQMAANPEDAALIAQPDLVAELENALTASTSQSVDQAMKDLLIATSDWTDWVHDCAVPILLFHGDKNTVAPISVVRAFAADFPELITLIEIEGAGFMVAETHRDELTKLLMS